jgi:hypothetical protein
MKDEWKHPTSERCCDNYVSLLFRERLDHLLNERGRDVASAGELFAGGATWRSRRPRRRRIAGRAGFPGPPPKRLPPPRRSTIRGVGVMESRPGAGGGHARRGDRRRLRSLLRARRARSRRQERCGPLPCRYRRSPSASALTHSAPARVLPAPRPPRMSQVVQGLPLPASAGGFW